MATAFQPAPTWAPIGLIDPVTQAAYFNPVWIDWFLNIAQLLSSVSGGSGGIDHNSTADLQGGNATERFHLDQDNYDTLVGDPGADRIIFWDDSVGTLRHLAPGTGMSITGTALNAAGGGGNSLTQFVYNASQVIDTDFQIVVSERIEINNDFEISSGAILAVL